MIRMVINFDDTLTERKRRCLVDSHSVARVCGANTLTANTRFFKL